MESGRRHFVGARLSRIVAAALIALTVPSCAAVGSPSRESRSAYTAPSAGTTAIAEPPTNTPSPLASADGRHVAAGLALVRFPDDGSPASEIFVVEADGAIRQLTGLGDEDSIGASLPVWSPDGRRLAFGPPKDGAAVDRYLSVINADGTGARPIAVLAEEFGVPFAWSPNGSSILYGDVTASYEQSIWLAVPDTGEVTRLGTGQLPRWLPDGRRIGFRYAIEGQDPSDPLALTDAIYVVGVEGGEPTEFARVADAVWSPDGTAVLLQEGSDRLLLADADGSGARAFVQGWAPAWSPNSEVIVFAYDHDQNGVPLLAAVDRTGRRLWSGMVGSSPTWSTDGSRLAVDVPYPDLVVHVLDAATGEVLWETAGTQPAWAP